MGRLALLWHENCVAIVMLAVLLVAFVALRQSPTEIGSLEKVIASLSGGEPTVLVFYSNT